jgi:hypothetical protein
MRQNFKLKPSENFISTALLKNLIKTTDIPKAIIEETTSELWYETLNGVGKIEFKNNITYEGNLRYGILDTQDTSNPCVLTFPDGTKYTGTMKNGEITGEGEYTFSNGATYTGQVLNGLRHGKGIYKSEGILFEGEWKNGLKHGKGKIKQEGMELEGEWDEGVLKGKCRIKWKTGNIYEGELVNNKMCGNGYMIWYDKGEKYTGQWDNNLQNGFGIHIWYDSNQEMKYFRDRYVGQWKDGKRDGYGKFFYSNGNIYEGYWKNNKKEGFGILCFQDRTKYIGNFKDDIMIDNLPKEQLNYMLNQNKNNNSNNNNNNINDTSMNYTKSRPSLNATELKNNISKLSNVNNTKSESLASNQQQLNTIKEKTSSDILSPKKNKNVNISKDIIEEEKYPQKSLKEREKESKIIKNLDEIKIKINLSDLVTSDPEIKNSLKEIDNLLLRNLSLITHLYMVSCGKEDIKNIEVGTSTISRSLASDTKSFFNKNLQGIKKDKEKEDFLKNKGEDIQNQQNNEEKKEKNVEFDNVYNNDLYFCLDFKFLWKLIRECGILSPQVSLAVIDRMYFQNFENYIDMYYLPDFLEKNNQNRKDFPKIYDFLFKRIKQSKFSFDSKYKSQIDQNTLLLYGKVNVNNNMDFMNEENMEELDDFNLHEEKNVILLRYFYEIIIRIAYLRFSSESKLPLEKKVKLLIDILKSYFRGKRKTSLDISINASIIIDPKLRNFDNILESYIHNHHEILKDIFTELYKYNCDIYKPFRTFDMTITHKFFFEKIIMNTKNISKLFENKMNYIELITIYFREKKFQTRDNTNFDELFQYIEDVFNYEMIFREFCELLFFISRKYFIYYKIDTEEEDNKGRNVKEEDNVGTEENDRDKKKKKTRKKKKSEDVDLYMIIIKDIIEAKDLVIQKPRVDPVNKYTYPKLNTHNIIERLTEEARQRKLEEERRAKDKIRYEKEREAFKNEDINIYKESNEEEQTNSDYSDY